MREGVFDLEANGLLDDITIDYTASPYKLKDSFKLHCAAIVDINNGNVVEAAGREQLWDIFLPEFLKLDKVVGHNILDYDLLVLKLFFGINYKIYPDNKVCTINGREVEIVDTLVVSKTLNPDRYGGHSLDAWGERVGCAKIDWRAKAVELGLIEANAPKGAEFQTYHPEMLKYNVQDCKVNVLAYKALLEEMGSWDYKEALILEHQTRDIITRQSHRGFKFATTKAEECVRDLDAKMEEIKAVVEPLLPAKPLGATKLKAFMPPKIQFKKNGDVSAVMEKWVEKHGGRITDEAVELYGKTWTLPLDTNTPVVTHEPATVKDTTHIKGWLVELGWRPTQFKERDLTVDSKKQKVSWEKYEAAVDRYVEQTLSSPFCKARCAELDTTPQRLRDKLLRHDLSRPMKVYTNPTITVGQEKEIDPALLELADKFPHAKLVSDFLTYSHRRNSILGGGVDPDEWEEGEEDFKGFLAYVREDGRIPTPADSCGAGSMRMKHKICANIPRATSLYGGEMRELFGADLEGGFVQLGYDFASLEACVEAHYCWKYDQEEKPYCNSLIQEKPFDVHTKTAEKISQVIGQDFKRTPAKSVKYACAYGARPARVARTVGCSLEMGEKIFNAYWEAAKPLALLGEKLKHYWQTTGGKKFILGIDGRKIPTRSASALINSLFQSTGVICAKKAMVLHEQKMAKAGLVVDFFLDDWKSSTFAQQMIAYHDESQLEVSKRLVKWKLFPTEEEAKAFRKVHTDWSEVGHSAKGWYVGYCPVGVMIQEAVKEVSKHFKLNVSLSADYVLGDTWKTTH